MISARLWRRHVGEVGGTLTVNGAALTIIGILPDGFTGLSGKADVWIPPAMAARLYYAEYLTTPQHFISVVARLKDGVSLRQANAELAEIGPALARDGSALDAVWSAAAVPLQEARVDPILRQSALALLVAAACVLVIACVSVAALLLARARVRRREIAVRLARAAGTTTPRSAAWSRRDSSPASCSSRSRQRWAPRCCSRWRPRSRRRASI